MKQAEGVKGRVLPTLPGRGGWRCQAHRLKPGIIAKSRTAGRGCGRNSIGCFSAPQELQQSAYKASTAAPKLPHRAAPARECCQLAVKSSEDRLGWNPGFATFLLPLTFLFHVCQKKRRGWGWAGKADGEGQSRYYRTSCRLSAQNSVRSAEQGLAALVVALPPSPSSSLFCSFHWVLESA